MARAEQKIRLNSVRFTLLQDKVNRMLFLYFVFSCSDIFSVKFFSNWNLLLGIRF